VDRIDRAIINHLQDGFPVCDRPYAAAAADLGISEEHLIGRLHSLLADGVLSRFGPLYNVEAMGGCYSLVAMRLPEEELDRVAAIVNDVPEVAHNYERDHAFNMWFVLAVENEAQKRAALDRIESASGHPVYDMPKLEEYYLGLRLKA